MPEASLNEQPGGLAPEGAGWFVVNARDARWQTGTFGAYTRFEGETHFERFGINIGVLQPGQANCYYHGEDEQEDFIVLSGECLLIVEDQERPLHRWDFVHCPRWTEHVFVGAGTGPCVLLAVGSRLGEGVIYPDSEPARRHGAGAQQRTTNPDEAYAGVPADDPVRANPHWLPGD